MSNPNLVKNQTYAAMSDAELLEALGRAVGDIARNTMLAGEIVCEYISRGKTLDELAESTGMEKRQLEVIEMVGSRNLHQRLIFEKFPARDAMMKLAYSEQVRLLEQPLELLLENGEVLLVQASALTRDQTKQVMGDGRCRSLGEQRCWLEDRKAKLRAAAALPGDEPKVQYLGDGVQIGDYFLDIHRLEEILAKAKSNKGKGKA